MRGKKIRKLGGGPDLEGAGKGFKADKGAHFA